MTDRVLETFLENQVHEGMAFAAGRDRLQLAPLPRGGRPPTHYIATFDCRGLVMTDRGVEQADQFLVGIQFSRDFMRRVRPWEVAAVLEPARVHHPNVAADGVICVGNLLPGTPIADVLTQVYEILTYQKVTMREDDCMNRAACGWAREHKAEFPIDVRPLLERRSAFEIEAVTGSHLGA